jgi:hypothetical protein
MRPAAVGLLSFKAEYRYASRSAVIGPGLRKRKRPSRPVRQSNVKSKFETSHIGIVRMVGSSHRAFDLGLDGLLGAETWDRAGQSSENQHAAGDKNCSLHQCHTPVVSFLKQ